MYSSLFQYKRFRFGHFLAVVVAQLLFTCNVSSQNLTNTYLHHKCLTKEGEFKPGSMYDETINRLIKSFTVQNFWSGFVYITMGEPPSNWISLKCQCRGDSYGDKCRTCFNAGIWGLQKTCPRSKGRIIWFDQCFVEATTLSMYNQRARRRINYENNFFLHNANKVSGDAKLFNKETINFLKSLTVKASDENNKGEDGKMAFYAAGEKMIGTKKLYAMVQCIRDDFVMGEMKLCKKCLDTIITKDFSKCCDGKQGGRIVGSSCNFRYELYPFLRTNNTIA